MTTPSADRRPLRLWPGVVAVALQWLTWLALPLVAPEQGGTAMLAAIVFGVAVAVWWLFFSRVPWSERMGIVVLMALAVYGTSFLVHQSISNGMMGMMLAVFSIPALSLALVAATVATRHLSSGPRRAAIVAGILLACGAFTLLRTGGITGDAISELHWRWTPSPEELLLTQDREVPAPPPSTPPAATQPEARPVTPSEPPPAPPVSAPAAAATPERPEPTARAAAPVSANAGADWPGFRGPERNGVVRGVRIETDWSTSPPVELWRRPIGPGWSSFAVRGDLVYTQEQRGDDEVVSSYRLATGEPVWRHRDAVRFWESNGGAGPRGTPTVHDGRIYTLGATGIVNALDAGRGAVIWSRNAATDTGKEIPDWGLASSPLVIDDLVIVAVAGQLVAYDVRTGDQRWLGAPGGGGYSSPHLATIDGVSQVLLSRGARTISVAPASGTLLWEHSTGQPVVSIVQPALAADGVLIAAGDAMGGNGMRRIAVTQGPAGWSVEERWMSRGLKPYFNDFVVHDGHVFGFDASILACINLADGERAWKGGRYGHGQLLLLPDQDVLLILSEEGELALVRATADRFAEIARFPALEGKTWNHPVLVGDVLLVRNGEEMAAFRLSRTDR